MLTENAVLYVSYNNYTTFAINGRPVKSLNPITQAPPLCYFQYLSKVQLDTHDKNYSIIFKDNNERIIQDAYNNLPIVHCSWLPQSAYNTAMPLIVNNDTFNTLMLQESLICYHKLLVVRPSVIAVLKIIMIVA